jgi:hypothetical protein
VCPVAPPMSAREVPNEPPRVWWRRNLRRGIDDRLVAGHLRLPQGRHRHRWRQASRADHTDCVGPDLHDDRYGVEFVGAVSDGVRESRPPAGVSFRLDDKHPTGTDQDVVDVAAAEHHAVDQSVRINGRCARFATGARRTYFGRPR